MANQGFVQTLNLAEVTDGAQAIQNLAGGTVDADLRLFAGLSSKRSQLFWNRFRHDISNVQSNAALSEGTRIEWHTDYTYTDDDVVNIIPVNLLQDIAATYVGFDVDGVLTENASGIDIVFDRGEGFNQGIYDLNLTGGSGSGATAQIIVDSNGFVESVEITNSGNGYFSGDILQAAIPGNGTGFAIRIVGFPWKVLVVGNYAWDVSTLDTANLHVTIGNTSNALNGTYLISKNLNTGINNWGSPNNPATKAFDVNRRLYAQEKITNNFELYDVTGDGVLTQYDVNLMNEFYNNNRDLNWFIDYVNNNPTPSGSSRNNGTRIYNYLTGLEESVFDVDGTGEFSFDYNLLTDYVTNAGILYQRPSAAALINDAEVNSTGLGHVISLAFRVGRNPGYAVPLNLDEEPERPYFILSKVSGSQELNVFDNFGKYGTQHVCETTQTNYLSVSVGSTASSGGVEYRILTKYTLTINNSPVYYVKIVAQGSGFSLNTTVNNLTVKSAIPVFSSSSEYGVYDSNGKDQFFVRTNPRSSSESIKELIVFASKYKVLSTESSSYANLSLPTTTLVPDLILLRDDSLTLSNIQNLESPEIVDTGDDNFLGADGSFSYNIDDGYSGELDNITANVDESVYLRTTKYRIDENLYYQKEIKVNGLVTSYDPDGFNLTQTDLLEDISPGIYISNSLSQITNSLAADFAQKTRSFSSDYNPWQADPASGQLRTESFNVTINDLVWTTEIKLDVNGDFKGSGLNESLNDNFNPTLLSQGKSYKLKCLINGEEFYIIMRKP